MARKVSALTFPDGTVGRSAKRTETHTWPPMGEIKEASGDTDYLPPMFAAKLADETLTLVRVRTRINSGTSATIKVVRKTAGGVESDLATNIAVSTTSADSAAINAAIANNDELRPVVTAVSGTPKNMTITFVFERTV